MNYYEVKCNWFEPVEETDEVKKVSKKFLTKAVSVTDAEATVIDWHPSNYSQFEVESVTNVKITQVNYNPENSTDRFFALKILDDLDGRSAKPVAYNIIYEAVNIKDAILKAESQWVNAEIDSAKKYNVIVDNDLCDG